MFTLYDEDMDGGKRNGVEGMIIAIDGPAGAGKSTVAQELARRLGMGYLDTGAAYRALTLWALRARMDLDDEPGLASAAADMDLAVQCAAQGRPPCRVLLEGEDVTSAIRSREVSAHVSRVSSHPRVRGEMTRKLRAMARGGGFVVEGRDVGTAVFPGAEAKFFITATPAERARRRHLEMAGEGREVSLRAVRQEMERRDHLDSTREHDPLRRAPDALLVDTTHESVEQVVSRLASQVREQLPPPREGQ